MYLTTKENDACAIVDENGLLVATAANGSDAAAIATACCNTARLAETVRALVSALHVCTAPKQHRVAVLETLDRAGLALNAAGYHRELVYERCCDQWLIRVYRSLTGMAIIERVRGPRGHRPATWEAMRTPDDWIATQPAKDRDLYVRVAA